MDEIEYGILVADTRISEPKLIREPDFSAKHETTLYEVWLKESIISNITESKSIYGTFRVKLARKPLKEIHPLDLAYMNYLANEAIEKELLDE